MLEGGPKRIFIAEPRGLCAGVVRSLDAYDQALKQKSDAPLYSVGEPAHNTHINQKYRKAGINFVDSVNQVPLGARALLGPHGTEMDQKRVAQERGLTVLDTTCPLVTKVEDEIVQYTQWGVVTIYWGDPNHQEAKSAISAGEVILVRNLEEAMSDEVAQRVSGKNGVAFASQTTFNADEATELEKALREKYNNLITPRVPDRCYATRNRQEAVNAMIKQGATFIVIVGSPTSSNSKRLFEIALEKQVQAIFVDSAEELDVDSLAGYEAIGFESGASVEEIVFQEVVEKVRSKFDVLIEPVIVADESRIKFASVKPVSYEPQFIHQPRA